MLRIGLTGGIGAGKSTVAAVLADLGALVADADQFAREVVAPGSAGLAAVVQEFGPQVLGGDGSLDRAALGRLVFADPERRSALERITHPLVAERTAQLVAAAPQDAVIVHDVPLIVEKSMGALYHLVLVVDAPPDVRVRRLVEQRGMAEAEALSRMAAQADEARRRAAADVWLDNDRPSEVVAEDLGSLWRERLLPFERNIRDGVRAARPQRAEVVAYRDDWAAAAARLVARVDVAAGSLGRGTQHIGSTAVPGLAAKDVIDLQLGVASLADADQLQQALRGAGFPHVPGITQDEPHDRMAGATAAAGWSKRFHANADPVRAVNLHVREVGGPGWRTALLLRDWWRADAGERAAYEGEKRRLSQQAASTAEYAAAKEAVFAAAVRRADDWAGHTGWTPSG